MMHVATRSALILAFVLVSLEPPLAHADCVRNEEFDQISAVVTEGFYDRTFRGLDWPQRVARARAGIDCNGDERALARVVNDLLGELHASHTDLYTREDPEYWALHSIFSRSLTEFAVPFLGIWPQRRDDRWFAKYVLDASPAQFAGIRAGDELIRMNGGEYTAMPRGEITTLTISSDGKRQRTVTLTPQVKSLQRFLYDATFNSRRIIEIGRARVGYFHLWAGTHGAYLERLNAALQEFEKVSVDAIVVDFRGGFGGAGPEYAERLRRIARPKYLLIDDGVRSGKEWVTALVKRDQVATVVGSRTAGAVLAASVYPFADDRYLLYLAVEPFAPEGIGVLEGIGVEPDIAVAPCREHCAGRDPQLEKVFELIGERRPRE